MNFSFQWKEYVYEVYKERSFSKAAHNLFISQPSLSARIKKIEDELGVPLFDRSTTPLKLTETGNLYVQSVEEIFQIEQRLENHINNMLSLHSGHLTIGTSTLFAAYVLPSLITRFKNLYPDVSIRVVEGNTDLLQSLLENGTLDFVIDNYHYNQQLYEKEFYGDEIILLAVPRNFTINDSLKQYQIDYTSIADQNKLRTCHSVPLSAFSTYPFIMLSPGNDTRTRGTMLCQNAGFHPNIIMEFNQQLTAYMAASTKLGITFISDLLVRQLPSFEDMIHYRLDGEYAQRQIFFYYKKHRHKTKAMEEFLRLIHNE